MFGNFKWCPPYLHDRDNNSVRINSHTQLRQTPEQISKRAGIRGGRVQIVCNTIDQHVKNAARQLRAGRDVVLTEIVVMTVPIALLLNFGTTVDSRDHIHEIEIV